MKVLGIYTNEDGVGYYVVVQTEGLHIGKIQWLTEVQYAALCLEESFA